MATSPRVGSSAVEPSNPVRRDAQDPFAKPVNRLEALQAHDMAMPERELFDCGFCFCDFTLLFLLSCIGLPLIAQ